MRRFRGSLLKVVCLCASWACLPLESVLSHPPSMVNVLSAQKSLCADGTAGSCLIAFDDVYHLSCSDASKNGLTALLLSWELSRSPYGRRDILNALKHHTDTGKAIFATGALAYCGDLSTIPALVACADSHDVADSVVKRALECIDEQLGRRTCPSGGEAGVAQAAQIVAYRRALAACEAEWKGVPHAVYWGKRVDRGLRGVIHDQTSESREFLSQSWHMFLCSRDAATAAPQIITWLQHARPENDRRRAVIPMLIQGLQLYTGPLEVPQAADAANQEKARTAVLSWWSRMKTKRPAYWLLSTLHERGYGTSNPADIGGTAAALIHALTNGDAAERYAAGMFLAQTIPNGEGLVLDSRIADTSDRQEDGPSLTKVRALLHHSVLSRAYYWYVCEGAFCLWDESMTRYIRSRAKESEAAAERH